MLWFGPIVQKLTTHCPELCGCPAHSQWKVQPPGPPPCACERTLVLKSCLTLGSQNQALAWTVVSATPTLVAAQKRACAAPKTCKHRTVRMLQDMHHKKR